MLNECIKQDVSGIPIFSHYSVCQFLCQFCSMLNVVSQQYILPLGRTKHLINIYIQNFLYDLYFFCFYKFIYFIYFCLCWVFVAARGLSVLAASRGYSVAVLGLLIAVASLLVEHGLQVHGLQQLWHAGSEVVARGLQSASSVVAAHSLSCSTACGIFLDQGSNLCPLRWQADS